MQCSSSPWCQTLLYCRSNYLLHFIFCQIPSARMFAFLDLIHNLLGFQLPFCFCHSLNSDFSLIQIWAHCQFYLLSQILYKTLLFQCRIYFLPPFPVYVCVLQALSFLWLLAHFENELFVCLGPKVLFDSLFCVRSESISLIALISQRPQGLDLIWASGGALLLCRLLLRYGRSMAWWRWVSQKDATSLLESYQHAYPKVRPRRVP